MTTTTSSCHRVAHTSLPPGVIHVGRNTHLTRHFLNSCCEFFFPFFFYFSLSPLPPPLPRPSSSPIKMSSRNYEMADSTLVREEDIHRKTAECAKKIAAAYRGAGLTHDNPLVLVCVLKGSVIFTADLIRHLSDCGVPAVMEFVCCSSYGASTTTSGEVRLLLDVRQSLENKHVLIVEDIVDSAVTLSYLVRTLSARKPASVKTVVLLDKPEGRQQPFEADFVVASIPNRFVVGYGLDFAEKFRGLRDVVVLKPSYYEKPKQSKL
eukprot:gene10018-6995_t